MKRQTSDVSDEQSDLGERELPDRIRTQRKKSCSETWLTYHWIKKADIRELPLRDVIVRALLESPFVPMTLSEVADRIEAMGWTLRFGDKLVYGDDMEDALVNFLGWLTYDDLILKVGDDRLMIEDVPDYEDGLEEEQEEAERASIVDEATSLVLECEDGGLLFRCDAGPRFIVPLEGRLLWVESTIQQLVQTELDLPLGCKTEAWLLFCLYEVFIRDWVNGTHQDEVLKTMRAEYEAYCAEDAHIVENSHFEIYVGSVCKTAKSRYGLHFSCVDGKMDWDMEMRPNRFHVDQMPARVLFARDPFGELSDPLEAVCSYLRREGTHLLFAIPVPCRVHVSESLDFEHDTEADSDGYCNVPFSSFDDGVSFTWPEREHNVVRLSWTADFPGDSQNLTVNDQSRFRMKPFKTSTGDHFVVLHRGHLFFHGVIEAKCASYGRNQVKLKVTLDDVVMREVVINLVLLEPKPKPQPQFSEMDIRKINLAFKSRGKVPRIRFFGRIGDSLGKLPFKESIDFASLLARSIAEAEPANNLFRSITAEELLVCARHVEVELMEECKVALADMKARKHLQQNFGHIFKVERADLVELENDQSDSEEEYSSSSSSSSSRRRGRSSSSSSEENSNDEVVNINVEEASE